MMELGAVVPLSEPFIEKQQYPEEVVGTGIPRKLAQTGSMLRGFLSR